MSKVHSVNTKPEISVRSFLHKSGFRFRLHARNLPGHPDIVLPKYKTVIFVHGCFWHRHKGCAKTTTPLTNTEFWEKKFQRNVERDKKAKINLKKLGWKVIVIWECKIKRPRTLAKMVAAIKSEIKPIKCKNSSTGVFSNKKEKT